MLFGECDFADACVAYGVGFGRPTPCKRSGLFASIGPCTGRLCAQGCFAIHKYPALRKA